MEIQTNMKTKHTQGPWNTDEQVIFASSGEAVASTWKFGQFDTGGRGSHAEADANARLIAAAPDLLALVCEMLNIAEIDGMDENSNVWRSAMISARAAITKAQGDIN